MQISGRKRQNAVVYMAWQRDQALLGNQNALKHGEYTRETDGEYTRETKEFRKYIRSLLKSGKEMLDDF